MADYFIFERKVSYVELTLFRSSKLLTASYLTVELESDAKLYERKLSSIFGIAQVYLTHRVLGFSYEVTMFNTSLAIYYCPVGVMVPHRSIYIEPSWKFSVNFNVHIAFNLYGKIHSVPILSTSTRSYSGFSLSITLSPITLLTSSIGRRSVSKVWLAGE